jgi:hypothetical protein
VEDKNRTKNIYEDGIADERVDTSLENTSRFRPTYRGLTPEEKALHNTIKEKAKELEDLIFLISYAPKTNLLVPGETTYNAKAIEALEISVMWAIKALTY